MAAAGRPLSLTGSCSKPLGRFSPIERGLTSTMCEPTALDAKMPPTSCLRTSRTWRPTRMCDHPKRFVRVSNGNGRWCRTYRRAAAAFSGRRHMDTSMGALGHTLSLRGWIGSRSVRQPVSLSLKNSMFASGECTSSPWRPGNFTSWMAVVKPVRSTMTSNHIEPRLEFGRLRCLPALIPRRSWFGCANAWPEEGNSSIAVPCWSPTRRPPRSPCRRWCP
eukprot:7377493-Prymnesium_polylepis.1